MNFSFFTNDIHNAKPISVVDLEYFIKLIKYSNANLREVFAKLQNETDKKERAKLKEHLYYATPAVIVNGGRKYTDIVEFTGLMPLDFDKIEHAEEFRNYLFEEYPFIIAAWLSSSKKGVRALVKIPICQTTDQFKAYFHGLADTHMKAYNGFDAAPQNCVLPLFISYDNSLLYRANATIWTGVAEIKQIIPNIQPISQNFNSNFEKWSLSNFQKSVDKIVSNGHPQLRAAAFVLGGRVGAGYVSLFDAINFANHIITTNAYLNKGIKGYQRTAKEMIIHGTNYPLYYERR